MTTTKGKAIQMGVSVDASIDGSVAGSIDASVADSIDASIAASTVPWREALNVSQQELPGAFLAGARFREGMTQEQLAAATGIPRRHISEMENNKRPIGKKNARKLAEALHVDPRVFLLV